MRGGTLSQRIGEFLKELEVTEGRSTGIPKILKEMAANHCGSRTPAMVAPVVFGQSSRRPSTSRALTVTSCHVEFFRARCFARKT
ncbi:hypothetical protein E4P82_12245 [Candidatus Competibacter phosphatis]|uniref:ATP-dependent DNA helicase RecG C-terminal domain-containing protein n=1 Tax=Candidatus Competibacter phosphatis TaxID=221280 RepID=A0ABX1TKH7_9GAMM|nr:hypothetical protein [Candidatus Competibacter phosphatis]